MKHALILLWLCLAQSAFGQTVVVKSGDHDGFTRLVVELPKVTDWQLGRTAEGYVLRLSGDPIRFDVTGVFKDIDRSRLAAIWMDPETMDLRLGIACACHALPFEFRPGIIVIDLRDGPPPKGSSFEQDLDGTEAAQLAARPHARPRARPQTDSAAMAPTVPASLPYDWLKPQASKPSETLPQTLLPPHAVLVEYHDFGPFRDTLLLQLSKGAAQGIVQMRQPNLASRTAAEPQPIGPRANIRIGDLPGFAVATTRKAENTLIKDGAECIPDAALDIKLWGNDDPAPIQFAASRNTLLGEFDKPDPPAVIAAAKLFIHFGFGAEARQLLAQMPIEDTDSALWISMAKLVDGASDVDGPFAGMHLCDTAAALWATLAMPDAASREALNTQAVLRSFSALPSHLRRNLGPGLAAGFLASGDLATARALTNTALRGTTAAEPRVAVMQASLDLATGDPTAAAAQLEPVLQDAGPATAETLIALVDARIAAQETIDPEIPETLAALLREHSGTDLEPALRRAQILALGASGNFDQAFALLPQMTDAETELWSLLATSNSESAVLNHAVLPRDARLPTIPAAQRSTIAAQLQSLGLSDMALIWIGRQSQQTPIDDRLLAAKAALSINRPEDSLVWLAGLEDTIAADLRAQALSRLGKPLEAAKAWSFAGNTDAELRAQSWARNWEDLSRRDPSAWQAAAALMSQDPASAIAQAPGPLALANALLADSTSTRATLSALLEGVAGPQSDN